MKACLNCEKEFEAKRPHAKYCSDKCRVAYNRKNPQNGVTKFQMQTLYNNVMAAINQINEKTAQPDAVGVILSPVQPISELPTKWLTKVQKEELKRKYVQERREFTCEDEHFEWAKRLEADERLSTEDKIQVKNTF